MSAGLPIRQGPESLWVIRHGESAGNVAHDHAHAAGEAIIPLADRDADVDLSDQGIAQAQALGNGLRLLAGADAIIVTSPYRRARHTADILAAQLATSRPVIIDERLRERELGVLDGLTRLGVERDFPDQAKRLTHLGKFYYRPPAGESWCDVILRLRSWLESACREYDGLPVVVVAHEVIVLCLRYILERLDEATLLRINAEGRVANCAYTAYHRDPQADAEAGLVLKAFNVVTPVAVAGAPVTDRPDVQGGDR